MSSKNRNVQVKMVRIQRPERPTPNTYRDDVTVGMPKDDETDVVYLRVAVNKKTILSEELDNFEWLDDCSMDGVVTLESPTSSMKVIILYDSKDRQSRDLIAQMDAHYHDETKSESSVPSESEVVDRTEESIDELVKSIGDGSSNAAERAARYLAKNQTKVRLNLISRHHDDDKTSGKKRTKSEASGSIDVLELKLQVECRFNREPLLETIYVRSGTKLHQLKEQIQKETGINAQDQYWFAFGQYIINNEYEFGSDEPVVPKSSGPIPKKQPIVPKDPIRTGDTLIMCIAQTRPSD